MCLRGPLFHAGIAFLSPDDIFVTSGLCFLHPSAFAPDLPIWSAWPWCSDSWASSDPSSHPPRLQPTPHEHPNPGCTSSTKCSTGRLLSWLCWKVVHLVEHRTLTGFTAHGGTGSQTFQLRCLMSNTLLYKFDWLNHTPETFQKLQWQNKHILRFRNISQRPAKRRWRLMRAHRFCKAIGPWRFFRAQHSMRRQLKLQFSLRTLQNCTKKPKKKTVSWEG